MAAHLCLRPEIRGRRMSCLKPGAAESDLKGVSLKRNQLMINLHMLDLFLYLFQ
jgi:hypothetical protein